MNESTAPEHVAFTGIMWKFPNKIPVSSLVMSDDEPPIYWPAVVSLVDGSRTDDRPIEVRHIPGTGLFRILNGRHRFIAAVCRGHAFVSCKVIRPVILPE